MQILGAMGRKAAIIEDGSTWTGSKDRPGPRIAKGENLGSGIKFATDASALA